MSQTLTLGIMQPYFLPYLGYWQLLNYVDTYVLYDDIQFIKGGYINRNSFLMDGRAHRFTVNLVRDSDQTSIRERVISPVWRDKNATKFLRQVEQSYRKSAPSFNTFYPVLKSIVDYENNNLFDYVAHSIRQICAHIGIWTPIVVSSTLNHRECAGEQRVIEICRLLDAGTYVNAIGGRSLYKPETFSANSMELKFLKPNLTAYWQGGVEFVPGLSIVDILMWNDAASVNQLLDDFSLVS